MAESTTTKYMGTDLLLEIAMEGRQIGYNRQLDSDWLQENVDFTGKHVVTPMMIHEHIDGVEADPHMRCSLFIKTKGNRFEPTEVIADMSMESYEALPTVTITVDDDGEKVITWNEE